MGGEIWCDSEPGVGSTFTFTSEFVCTNPAPPPPLGLEPRPLILLVDSKEDRRKAHAHMLEAWGFRVQAAFDCSSATVFHNASRTELAAIVIEQDLVFEMKLALTDAEAATSTLLLTNAPRREARRLSERLDLDTALSMPLTRRSTIIALSDVLGIENSDPAASKPERVGPVNSDARILVVEDNEVNRRVVGAMLERLGYHVAFAANGKYGVEAWQGGRTAGR